MENEEKQVRKIKLIYSGELLAFAVVFLVLGILELLRVIKLSDRFQLIFKIVTLVGATWLVTDFVWVMLSPKRKAKNSIMDKAMLLPLALYLYVFDILGFVLQPGYGYYQIGVPAAFFYISCVYAFQGIYHYYHPVPSILEMIEEAKKPEEPKIEEVPQEETQPVEEITENNEEK
jgi:hypothetical protein